MFHAEQQFIGCRPPGPGQPVHVVQIEKWLNMVVCPVGQVIGDVLPAVAHIDTVQLQAEQHRYGADLVLGIGFVDSPEMVRNSMPSSVARYSRTLAWPRGDSMSIVSDAA